MIGRRAIRYGFNVDRLENLSIGDVGQGREDAQYSLFSNILLSGMSKQMISFRLVPSAMNV